MTREELMELALRYVPREEMRDFPWEGDLFALLHRSPLVGGNESAESAWECVGYGMCLKYTLDNDAKPAGKWVWMHFVSLTAFPPVKQVLKLQPPHIVKGSFRTADTGEELRIVRIDWTAATAPDSPAPPRPQEPSGPQPAADAQGKILRFRRKTS